MLFGKKREKEIAEHLKDGSLDQSYWAMVRRQFRENRLAVWSLRVLYVLIFFAVFGDFIANEKPLYCKIAGETYFPVAHQYLVDLGFANWDAAFITRGWSDQDYETVIYPLIPYSSKTLDLENVTSSPFEDQNVSSRQFYHFLGTDQLGRDVMAGMIYGTRIALIVGIIAMGVATLIGLLLGGLAGFFGDDQLFASPAQLILNILGFIAGIFYGFGVRSFTIVEGGGTLAVIVGIIIFIGLIILSNLIAKSIDRLFPPKKKIAIPIDLIVMRLIEVMNSIPGLVLLLAILAIIEKSSIVNVMIILGLIGWTGIARFVRSELLRIRSLDYIEAARSMGFGEVRILLKHALPNALTPVLISIAFGIAGAILTEAFLSFIGIGMPPEEVSWGRMLYASRDNISSWWLAVFPGVAIFMTITIFNLLGEGLSEALNPRLRQ